MSFGRVLVVAAVVVLPSCASTPPPIASAPVAFANLAIAVRQCREGRAASEELRRTWRDKQEHLDRLKTELLEERAQIGASRARGEDVAARQAAFQNRIAAVHDEYKKLQADLTLAEQRRADQIRDRLKAILRQQAQARGITVISDADSAPNDGRRYVDLTADVIRAADATQAGPPS